MTSLPPEYSIDRLFFQRLLSSRPRAQPTSPLDYQSPPCPRWSSIAQAERHPWIAQFELYQAIKLVWVDLVSLSRSVILNERWKFYPILILQGESDYCHKKKDVSPTSRDVFKEVSIGNYGPRVQAHDSKSWNTKGIFRSQVERNPFTVPSMRHHLHTIIPSPPNTSTIIHHLSQ